MKGMQIEALAVSKATDTAECGAETDDEMVIDAGTQAVYVRGGEKKE